MKPIKKFINFCLYIMLRAELRELYSRKEKGEKNLDLVIRYLRYKKYLTSREK